MKETKDIVTPYMLGRMSDIMEYGGFIKEWFEDEVCRIFPAWMVTYVDGEYGINNLTLRAMADLPDVEEKIQQYTEVNKNQPFNIYEFRNWLCKANVRFNCERFLSKDVIQDPWQDWNLSMPLRKRLNSFSPLEKEIIKLVYGLSNKGKLNTKEIAGLPEFSGKDIYIQVILTYIIKSINNSEYLTGEFEKTCNIY